MKLLRKITLCAFAAIVCISANAQVFFTEEFEGVPEPNGLPTGWTETGLSTDGIWVMGDATAASSPYITVPAPLQGTNFAFTNDDACDCDKSADRMILPAQDLSLMANANMIFDTYNTSVYGGVTTVEVSIDGGATWTVLQTVPTDPAWQNDVTVSLAAYTGVGFNNVLLSIMYNDGAQWADMVAIDDIVLEETTAGVDVGITAYSIPEYTIVPLAQVAPISLDADVLNSGSLDATDAVLTVNVYDAINLLTPLQTFSSPSTLIAASVTTNLVAGTYTPTAEATYVLEFITSATGDLNAVNDSSYASYLVSDNVYARDDANVTFTAGIGAGPSGYLGSMYTINTATVLDSVLGAFTKPGTSTVAGDGVGDSTRYVIYDVAGGLPNVIIGASPIYVFTPADTGVLIVETLPIEATGGGQLSLAPGTYFVAAEENNTNVGLSFADNNFQLNTFYFSWTGQPWTPAENFPVQFQRTPVLRPILSCTSTSTDVIIGCDSITWIDGITYTASNNTAEWTLQNVNGCDSVVTLDLTINASSSSSESVTACGNYTWSANSTTYNADGIYTATLTNAAGCDSLATLNLTIGTFASGTDVIATCDSVTWLDGMTYTASNNAATFTMIGGSVNGCDSVITLDLTITQTPISTVSQVGATLTADQAGVSYQWLDCDNGNSPIAGETGQSFTATVTGNYAVQLSSAGCSSTSACQLVDFSGITTLYGETLTLYPNPSENMLNVDGINAIPELQSIAVVSLNGQRLLSFDINSETYDVSSLNSGMYFFVIEYGDAQKEAIKFIKK